MNTPKTKNRENQLKPIAARSFETNRISSNSEFSNRPSPDRRDLRRLIDNDPGFHKTGWHEAQFSTVGTILLIDNDIISVLLTRKILKVFGFKVKIFFNPVKALRWYRKNWESVELVFFDLKMEQLAAADCLDTLVGINPNARTAATTRSIDPRLRSELRIRGVEHFFEKPFDPTSLVTWVLKSLDRSVVLNPLTAALLNRVS